MNDDVAQDPIDGGSDAGVADESPLIRAARRQAFEGLGRVSAEGPFPSWTANIDIIPPRFGPYRIKRRIGVGGMGAVYEAEQESPKRTVAVKVGKASELSEQALRRFHYETRLLARLQHPGIAQIFEVGVIETPAGDRKSVV